MPCAQPALRVARPPVRPLLLFDGECGFCRRWIERWRTAYGMRLDFAPAQEVGPRFLEIPPERFNETVHLIEPDGRVHSGASAALRARAVGRGRRGWLLWVYESLPGAAPVLESGYRIVARNRRVFSMLMR